MALIMMCRLLEVVDGIATRPQTGFWQQARPVFKNIDFMLDKLFQGFCMERIRITVRRIRTCTSAVGV
jgi:hypothetical protein